jgi:hypothetical protein
LLRAENIWSQQDAISSLKKLSNARINVARLLTTPHTALKSMARIALDVKIGFLSEAQRHKDSPHVAQHL